MTHVAELAGTNHLVRADPDRVAHQRNFVRQREQDVALFYGRDGEDGETVLRYASRPDVKVVAGTVSSTFVPAR